MIHQQDGEVHVRKRVANGSALDLITGKAQKQLENDVSFEIQKEEHYDL